MFSVGICVGRASSRKIEEYGIFKNTRRQARYSLQSQSFKNTRRQARYSLQSQSFKNTRRQARYGTACKVWS